MIFKNVFPCYALKDYVSLYRLRHFIIPPNLEPHPKPYPPHPEQCMIFYPRGAEITNFAGETLKTIRPKSLLAGQFTQRIDRKSLHDEIIVIVVVFKPGVLHRITGIPFNLLIDTVIDLESIYPKMAKEVNEKLANSNDYDEMISIIESFLIHLSERPKIESRRCDAIFESIARNEKDFSLEFLARESCLSMRQFERKSYEYIGVSPKFFGRIARFNQSYYMSIEKSHPNWLDISLECGYHDYQHLVKDYKEFTQATPRNFFNEESRSLERALGLSG